MSGIMSMLLGAKTAIASAVDAFFNRVTLLLPGDGTNGAQNNTFLDSSTNNFSITRNGNATQGTFSPFSQTGWSNYFDGTDDYLAVADNAVLRPGSGSFTLEAWIYRGVSGAAHTIYAKGGASTGIVFQVTSGNVLRFTHTTTNIDSTGTISANAWTHVAVVREGTGTNQTKLYINGTQDGQGTVSTDFTQTEEVRIGTNRGATEDFNGYISNLRFTKGAALYTGTFTPSTSPLTTTSQGASATDVELLTCQSNRFIDNSTNAFAITVNGNTSIQAFSPFAPTAAYSAATVGGSGYFDGTGDFLTNASADLSTAGNITVECWVYPSTISGTDSIINIGNEASGRWAFVLSNGIPTIDRFGIGATSFGSAVRANSWTHIAFVRSSNTVSCYVDGTSVGTPTSMTGTAGRAGLYIGVNASSINLFDGYISNLRVANSAVYTSNFTSPIVPLTAIANTSLLLSCTNAGITDATAKNVLETVGNAQISTTQSKWGGGSMYFDGTGDYLTSIWNPANNIGSSTSWTIEFWGYVGASFGTYCPMSFVQDSTNRWGIELGASSTNVVFGTPGSTSFTHPSSLSTNTWFHFALVRDGSTVKLYINGTASSSTSSFNLQSLSSSAVLFVGRNNVSGFFFDWNGYIDDLRITRGLARYTANFTPPTAAFALQ